MLDARYIDATRRTYMRWKQELYLLQIGPMKSEQNSLLVSNYERRT